MINVEELKTGFLKKYQKEGEYYIDTGGRFEICGNHTDHNHGLCLVANCSLRVRAIISKNSETVNIQSRGYATITFSLKDLSLKEAEYGTTLALCKGILFKMKEEGYSIGGFNCFMDSEIPDGSGVSSSAAVESLFGYIISYLYNDGKIAPIVIAKNGQYSENNYFHKPCGLLDQIGTSFDSSNFIDFKDIANPIVTTLPFNLPVSLYLIKSTGNHSNLTDLYASIPNAMYKVAEALDHKHYLRDVNVLDVYERIDKLEGITDSEKRKAKHFFYENNNVRMAKHAIEENNLEDFFGAIRSSQHSSKNNLENTFVKGEYEGSMQEIVDKVSDYIGSNGAIRIHGGGFKGTCLCFIKNSFVEHFDKFLAKNYPPSRVFKVAISAKAVNFEKIEPLK
jgi:Galactokinase